jgi:hypothetical protein
MVAEPKPIVLAEFDKFLAAPENRDKQFQLINGEAVVARDDGWHRLGAQPWR